MPDDFISRINRVLQDIRRDIAEMDKTIERAEEQRARFRAQQTAYEQTLAVYRQVMGIASTPQEQLPLVGTLRGSIPDMCAQVMEIRGGPVKVVDLVDLLTAAGKFRNPANKRGNYGTVFGMLRRDERFGKTPRRGEFFLRPGTDQPLFNVESQSA